MNVSVIKAALAYVLSALSVQGVAFLTQLILLRYFSVTNYGFYAISFEAVIMANMVISGAFRNFYLKEIRKGVNPNILMSYQLYYGSLGCLISSVFTCTILQVPIQISIYITMSMVFSSLILPISTNLLAKGYKWRIISRDITISLLSFCSVIFLVYYKQASVSIIIISLLLIQMVVNLFFFLRLSSLCSAFSLKNLNFINDSMLPFLGIFLLNTIYNKIGVSYVNFFSDVATVATFLAAFKFVNPFFSIQAALISAIMPNFISKDNIKFDVKFFSFFALPGLLISGVLMFFFPYIIKIIELEKYGSLYDVILFLSPVIFIVFIYGALSNFISVSGGQSYILKTNILGVLIYIFILIIAYFLFNPDIIINVVISSFVITESFVCGLYYYRVKRSNEITVLFLVSPVLIISYELFLIFFKGC